jgi:hypothetical protein
LIYTRKRSLGSSSKKREKKIKKEKKKKEEKRRKSIEPKYSSKCSKFKREKYPLKEESKIRFPPCFHPRHVTPLITIVPPYIHHHIHTHFTYIGPHTCTS